MKNFLSYPSRTFALVVLFLIAVSSRLYAQEEKTAAVHVGFIYPVSSNGKQAVSYTNRFSLHVIAGLSKAETGVAMAGVANVIREDARGVQMAGVANLAGSSTGGVQMAGVVNVLRGNAAGAQLAGFANMVGHEAKGAQLAGFMNFAENAGAAQVAGVANIATKDVKGAQVAGFLNKANEVHTQIGGFANVAKKVKGIQLAGFINIADSSDYPIAIFNFIKNGEKSVAVSLDEMMTTTVSFRSGGRVLYGIAGIGYNLKDNAKDMFAAEGGLGAHIPLASALRVNVEAVSHTLTDFDGGAYFKNSLRILPALKLGNRFEAFAGPTLNYATYDRENDYDFIKKYLWKNNTSKDFQGLFIGVNAGIQVLF